MDITNDEDSTPLIISCGMGGSIDIAALLLDHNASINHRNHDGYDALLNSVCCYCSSSRSHVVVGDGHRDDQDVIGKRVALIQLLVASGIVVHYPLMYCSNVIVLV